MGEQFIFQDNKLRIVNPVAPLVSSITVNCDKDKYTDVLDTMSKVLTDNVCILKSLNKEELCGVETDLTILKERGFVKVCEFNEHNIYIGKLPETNVDIVILHDVKDNRSVKQVYLSPRLHSRECNLSYINELRSSI